MISYIQAISIAYPNVQCRALGDGSEYDSLIWESGDALPTKQQLDTFIDAYVAPAETTLTIENLNSGLPAYMYAPANELISIEKSTLVFSAKTTGAKNFWLNTANTDGATTGYHIANNSMIKNVSFSTKNNVQSEIVLKFRQIGTTTDLLSITIPAQTKTHFVNNLATKILANTQLSCYIVCTNNVADILVTIDLAECN